MTFILILLVVFTMAKAFEVGETRQITVSFGATTNATVIGPGDQPIKFIWGHGLGSKDPELRTRFNDGASNITFSAMEKGESRCICYDARGHGASHGWEDTAEDRIQFSWPNLAEDMVAVAGQYGLEKVVVGGSSMGSATALYTAIRQPDTVAGLILVRPPTAWEERLARKPQLYEAARILQEKKPDSLYYNVLLGSAISNLPPLSALKNMLKIPVLILTAEGDPTHPVSTARALTVLSEDTQLFVSASYDDGKLEWPDIIAEFLKRVKTTEM